MFINFILLNHHFSEVLNSIIKKREFCYQNLAPLMLELVFVLLNHIKNDKFNTKYVFSSVKQILVL